MYRLWMSHPGRLPTWLKGSSHGILRQGTIPSCSLTTNGSARQSRGVQAALCHRWDHDRHDEADIVRFKLTGEGGPRPDASRYGLSTAG